MNEEFALSLKTNSDKMKADHIQEMQLMLQEFERAKNYLKSEIAMKNQQ